MMGDFFSLNIVIFTVDTKNVFQNQAWLRHSLYKDRQNLFIDPPQGLFKSGESPNAYLPQQVYTIS